MTMSCFMQIITVKFTCGSHIENQIVELKPTVNSEYYRLKFARDDFIMTVSYFM